MASVLWVLYGIWSVGSVVFGVLSCRDVYGRPGETRPFREIQPGNPGSAILCGVLYGLTWPWLLLVVGLDYGWSVMRPALKSNADRHASS